MLPIVNLNDKPSVETMTVDFTPTFTLSCDRSGKLTVEAAFYGSLSDWTDGMHPLQINSAVLLIEDSFAAVLAERMQEILDEAVSRI